jgi:competence protein ComEC
MVSPRPSWYRVCCIWLLLTSVLGAVGSRALTEPADETVYFPLCSKPVPTPTVTPTATPIPRLMDVRIDSACSSFRGGSAQNPSGEYVCLANHDSDAVNMTGWRLEDASRHRYVFPVFSLLPGARVNVHSGPGVNTATDLYSGSGLIWNNDHDVVHLYDLFDRSVSTYVY